LSAGAGSSALGVEATPFTYEGSSLAYTPTESAVYTTNPAETTTTGSFDFNKFNQGINQLQKATGEDDSNKQSAPQVQRPQQKTFNGKYTSQYGSGLTNNGSVATNNPFMNGK